MTDDLPDPMTPPDCDLRGYDWMPLHGGKLYSSHFDAHATDAEFRAAHKLWWASWNEVPAASMPDDDAILCRDAGFGRDVKAWSKVRKMALWGFVKCSDGRLYHRFLAGEAVAAFEKRLKADTKRKADRERLRLWREAQKATRNDADEGGNGNEGGNDTRNTNGPAGETRTEAHKKRDVKRVSSEVDKTRQDISKERTVLRTAPQGVASSDIRAELWRDGLPILRAATGRSEGACRGFLGKVLKILGDDCAVTLGILREAESLRPADPAAWITQAAAARAPGKPTEMDEIRGRWNLPGLQFHTSETVEDQSEAIGSIQ